MNHSIAQQHDGFPGRWIGGIALLLAPLLLLAGVLLRSPFHFFFPDQLRAYQEHPSLMFWSYSTFNAGILLLWPAVLTVVRMIHQTTPVLAKWAGYFVIFGLFARTFHAGVDHLAYQMVRIQGLDTATQTVADSYGAFHIFSILSLAILLGWIVLAIAAYRSKTLGLIRSIALALMSALPLGVLKGTTTFSIIAVAGLCIALMPLGIQVLRDGPNPPARNVLLSIVLGTVLIGVFYFIGQAG
ncbi:hypothetical protein [Paenibacillus glycanilyticus]|uniref:Uncharacterized protein n=1 Tax=Paenibacillus glycanilyticus TaxID=126569 RepID=A0ABQ6GFC0_9BACL|nr:hypothetical protein [Paenibacillus glycanilyticus]GLX68930.1 hypothetical protein MU1_32750 [Paenibacillus glycanilyticus]